MANLNQIIPTEKKEFIHQYPEIHPNSPIVWIYVPDPKPGTATQVYYETHELLNPKINPTDPIVVFDPPEPKKLYKLYDSVEPKNSIDGPSQVDTLRDDGINMPIIRLNNFSLKDENIDYMKIYFNDFLPKIHLVIKDKDNVIKLCDSPGWDNEIHVILISELNGYYKKISLLFYIINIELYDDYISYNGEWKFQPFNKSYVTQYPIPPEDKKLTTFELVKGIAKTYGVGFASTNNIPPITDYRYRIIKSDTLKKWIPYQVSFGGFGTDNIYDCWIDLNGYLVLVDVAWVINYKVEWKDFGIINMVGNHSETNSFQQDMLSPLLMPRVLTNNAVNTNNYNLLIDKYENIMDNEYVHEEGSLHKNYFIRNYTENNKIDELETKIVENSIEGAAYASEYDNDRYKLIGIEYEYEGDDKEVVEQQMQKIEIHDHFFTKLRSRVIKVLLKRYNLGLQRGTLIHVLFKEYDMNVVKAIEKTNNKITEPASGTINPYTSGFYYIDAMEFEYKQEEKKLNQYLFLCKKDPLDDIVTKINKPERIDDESSISDPVTEDSSNI